MVPPRALTRILCLIGPTASGKSALALSLARRFSAEIINADSRQFYREMHIGTAKPSGEELSLVPHHLIDCASITDPWDTARFVLAADRAIAEITARGHVPLVVGGTGMYLKHLISGLAEIPEIPVSLRQQLQQRLSRDGLDALYSELQTRDPEGAARLKPTDTQRILRALEVVRHTGRPIHDFWNEQTRNPRYAALKIALDLDRNELYRRIDRRVVTMVQAGLKDEARDLITRFPKNPVLLKTIGYAEWAQYGFADETAAVAAIQQNSRHFAKRQLTWFRREQDIFWLRAQDSETARQEAEAALIKFLN